MRRGRRWGCAAAGVLLPILALAHGWYWYLPRPRPLAPERSALLAALPLEGAGGRDGSSGAAAVRL